MISVPTKVCSPVQVFAWARFSEAITDPVGGETTSVPSLFDTELTAPPPPERP